MPHHGLAPEALVERLRQRQRLAVVPGAPRWFGPGAAGHLRLVFSTSEAILMEGLARLRRGVEELAGGYLPEAIVRRPQAGVLRPTRPVTAPVINKRIGARVDRHNASETQDDDSLNHDATGI